MKVFVTGATGFLGSELCMVLEKRGDFVIGVGSKDTDLRDQQSLDKYSHIKFDRIFHLAAWTQAGDFCVHHPGEQWVINQLINTHVLQWWMVEQPQAKMISIGTSCTYEENGDLCESSYLTGTPITDLFTYAMTKRMLQIGLESISRQFSLQYLTVVPSTLYGPSYPIHTGRQMHFIFDLMHKILANKYRGEKIILWGDGEQKRELVFLNDFVTTLLDLDGRIENSIINIGAGKEFSIRSFAENICVIAGVDPETIIYDTTRYVGAKSKCLNIDKLNSLLPNRDSTPLTEGLKMTMKWLERKFFL